MIGSSLDQPSYHVYYVDVTTADMLKYGQMCILQSKKWEQQLKSSSYIDENGNDAQKAHIEGA